jgi:Helix-turn-helix domain
MKTAEVTLLKAEALRATGTLNPRPERVLDPLFRGHAFFDAHDRVQVKYEMLRRVEREHAGVQAAASAFGFSRVGWYQVKARYAAQGLPGLLPRRRGPHPQKQSR